MGHAMVCDICCEDSGAVEQPWQFSRRTLAAPALSPTAEAPQDEACVPMDAAACPGGASITIVFSSRGGIDHEARALAGAHAVQSLRPPERGNDGGCAGTHATSRAAAAADAEGLAEPQGSDLRTVGYDSDLHLRSAAPQDEALHPLQGNVPSLLEHVRLVRAPVLAGLPTPVPRCQDLPNDAFGKPSMRTIVVAVSHAWPRQTNPDPNGAKHAQLLQQIRALGSAAFDEPGPFRTALATLGIQTSHSTRRGFC